MKISRYYTKNCLDRVYDVFQWKNVDVLVKNDRTGEVIFHGKNLEFPEHYSQNACDIIAKMYFRKKGVPDTGHEVSMKQVVHRMVDFWIKALLDEGLINEADSSILYDELTFTMLAQMWAPNTPQWFNTGLFHSYGIKGSGVGSYYWSKDESRVMECDNGYSRTPASACFITSIKDSLLGPQSLSENLATATKLFSYGSGVGSNWSDIRGNGEALSGGGVSSGLMSFLKVFDKNAGAIKSGGTHRRASVLNAVDLDHPEIFEFVHWKSKEEDKVRALGKMGYDISMNGDAYETVSGQNCNNSVSIPNTFMESLESNNPNATWRLKGRVDPSIDKDVLVKDLWDEICDSAWRCGDPGVQFSDTINDWNTVKNSGNIRSSNPCFTYDMKLLTVNGYKEIGSLSNKEEMIINANGDVSKSRIICSGVKDVVHMLLSNGERISCTPDHIFKTLDGKELEAKDMVNHKLLPFVNFSKYNLDKNYIDLGYTETNTMAMNQFPDGFSSWTFDEKRSYLNGCYTSKGEIVNNRVSFETKSKAYALQLMSILRNDFNIESYLVSVRVHNSEEYFDVNIDKPDSINRFASTIGFSDDENLNDLRNFLELHSPHVIGIRKGNAELVYDFSEPLTHWGVIEGYVAHNCSEFVFLNDNACNLASINILQFYDKVKKTFDIEGYVHVVKLVIMIMEGTAHWGCFPTPQIAENTYKFRPLGLGLTNLGAFLMTLGVPYDSPEGRSMAAYLTSVLTAQAYHTSSEMASIVGPFENFEINTEHMLAIIRKHYNACIFHDDDLMNHTLLEKHLNIKSDISPISVLQKIWEKVIKLGSKHGFRNAAVSLSAPTGTISFALDGNSTGIEPFFSHVVYKKIADGSFITMTNQVILDALNALGYSVEESSDIIKFIENNQGSIEGAPHLKNEDLSVFDTASKCGNGIRFISPMGHVKMIAAMQPHLSMSISKTINMPNSCTKDDISTIYRDAWRLGCKCIALYRDGSKVAQPLTTKVDENTSTINLDELTYQALLSYAKDKKYVDTDSNGDARRTRLPFEPKAIKNEIEMDDQTFHVIRSFYDDGRLGEIFMTVGKNGSTVKGLQEVLCMVVSKALQYGVPADVLAKTMRHHEFSPNGFVYNHPNIKSASSIPDLMSKFLDISSGNYQYCQVKPDTVSSKIAPIKEKHKDVKFENVYGERCSECGSDKIVKAGVCKYCQACGTSTGCS